MWSEMTRSRLIQVWFTAVALICAAGVTLGVSVTMSTAMTLAALSLVPPAMVLMLWPGGHPRSGR